MSDLQDRMNKVQQIRTRLDEAAFKVLKTDPWVPITMGQQFRLEYSYFAVKTMYQECGMVLTDSKFDAALLSDPELMAKALYYGLLTHQPEITQEQVERSMQMRHRVYYASCIQKAITATQPDLTDIGDFTKEATDDDPLAGTGISLSSGPSVTN